MTKAPSVPSVPSVRPDVRSLKERERTDISADGRPGTVDGLTCTNSERPDERPSKRPATQSEAGRIPPPEPVEERERWRAALDQYLARRERTAALREQLAACRQAGKAARHAERLRRNHDTAETRAEQDREDP